MKKFIIIGIIMVLMLTRTSLAEETRGIGLGACYKDSYLSYTGSFRTKVGLIMLDTSLDYFPPTDEFSYAFTPRISLLINILGTGIYAGLGIEKTYIQEISEKSQWSNLTYILQGGWEILSLPSLSLSLDARYKLPILSLEEMDLEKINPDSLTLGARFFFYF